MKIVLAPNALKGSCAAIAAGAAMAVGIARVVPTADLVQVPAYSPYALPSFAPASKPCAPFKRGGRRIA